MKRPDDDDSEDGMDTKSEIRIREGEKGGKALDREPLRKSEDETPVEKDEDSKDR